MRIPFLWYLALVLNIGFECWAKTASRAQESCEYRVIRCNTNIRNCNWKGIRLYPDTEHRKIFWLNHKNTTSILFSFSISLASFMFSTSLFASSKAFFFLAWNSKTALSYKTTGMESTHQKRPAVPRKMIWTLQMMVYLFAINFLRSLKFTVLFLTNSLRCAHLFSIKTKQTSVSKAGYTKYRLLYSGHYHSHPDSIDLW